MAIFSILAVDYFYHFTRNDPVRKPTDIEIEMAATARSGYPLSPELTHKAPASESSATLNGSSSQYIDRRMQLMIIGLGLSTLLLFVR